MRENLDVRITAIWRNDFGTGEVDTIKVMVPPPPQSHIDLNCVFVARQVKFLRRPAVD